LAARLNEAIDMAHGEYFARMDSDDVSYPERLARQIEVLQNDSNLDLVAARAIAINERGQVTGMFPYAISHEEICHQPWRGFYFPHPTWMGKTQWFRAHRYAVPAPYCCEDQELLLRSYRSSRFVTLNEVLFAYRIRSKVDWRKLAKTRRAIITFQLGYFLSMKLWHFAVLAIASYVAKTGRDLSKKYWGTTFYPEFDTPADVMVHKWHNVLDSLAAGAKTL
jgi:glycosyltransferase involved in cell wall biosynthesis